MAETVVPGAGQYTPTPSKPRHSAVPWRVCEAPSNFQKGKQFIRPVNSERLVATVSSEGTWEERFENARLIVRAVNAHDELVAALRALMPLVPAHSATLPKLEAATAALKKADAR